MTFTESLEFETAGSLTLVEFHHEGPSATVTLDARRNAYDSAPPERWRLTCADLRSWQCGVSQLDGAELVADHVLLARFHDDQVTLGIKGPALDPRHVIADLWERHLSVAGAWIPFGTYLNGNLPLAVLLASTAAVFAVGPRRLMESYAEVLAAHGVEVYEISASAPTRWTDGTWVPERRDVELLVLGNDTWFAGTGFTAERIIT